MEGKSPVREGTDKSHWRASRKAQKLPLQLEVPPQPRPPSQKVQGAHCLPQPPLLIYLTQRHYCSCALIVQASGAFCPIIHCRVDAGLSLLITGRSWAAHHLPQGHWMMSINKSVTATGFEMPSGERVCTISVFYKPLFRKRAGEENNKHKNYRSGLPWGRSG